MLYALTILFSLVSLDLRAETGTASPGATGSVPVPGATANPNAGLPNKGYKVNPNAVQTLDGDFFETKKEAAPAGSDNRYNAGEPDYNTEQRDRWIKLCEKYRGKDMEAFRKCYAEEKAKTQEGIRQGFESVEQRLKEPLRNTNPLLEEQRRTQSWGEE